MKTAAFACAVTFLLFAGMPALAQSADAAAERARLANQRISAEAQRRAEAEEERRRQEALQAQAAAAQSESSQAESLATDARATNAPANRADMHRVLEQLRELGELKDAGYLTDDEFAALKKKILDSAL